MSFMPGNSSNVWIAVYQCLMILLTTPVLFWLVYNLWTILVKQQKWKVIPLSTFYSLAITLVLVDIWKMVFFFKLLDDYSVVLLLYN